MTIIKAKGRIVRVTRRKQFAEDRRWTPACTIADWSSPSYGSLNRLPSSVTRELFVAAGPDGSVWLRGLIEDRGDAAEIERVVSRVPGVRQAYCHMAAR